MNNALASFTIADVAAITGIKKDTLRKWEQRYDFINPLRLSNGYRQYSQQQVQFLCLLNKHLAAGMSLKKAIAELEHTPVEATEAQSFLFQLLAYGEQCNERKFSYVLHQAHQTCGLSIYLTDIVQPFLKEVGNRWQTKQWSEYQEKFVSTFIQHHLITLRHQMPAPPNAKLVVGACLPHEQHELPLHILLLQILLRGYRIFLVGQSPAPGTIENFVTEFQPAVVLLSATTTIPVQHSDYVQRLDRFAATQPNTTFFIGGHGVESLTTPLQSISIAQSLEELWQALA